MRIPVLDPDGKPLMPTTPQRARRWVESGKAVGQWSKLGVWYVQLVAEPSGREAQGIAVGVDPGKLYSGVGVQSAQATLLKGHLVLPFKRVKERMEFRAMMRRGRRGRRINRKVAFDQRAHRQSRFSNRKSRKVPPSIRANRQLELRVLRELFKLFPISSIVYEYVKASGNKGFSPVMVGQRWMLEQLAVFGVPVVTRYGWETANMRRHLCLEKSRNKAEQSPDSHAVDGVALAATQFTAYRKVHRIDADGGDWFGSVVVTDSEFCIIRRPLVSRRQLHLAVPAKGGNRRKYGGTTTRHGVRKGDFVKAFKKGEVFYGWVGGDTKSHVSLSNKDWKRIGYFSPKKIQPLHRSTGLLAAKAA
ncbi:hypothetical protein S7335_1262 [Synechococcus sp. PCC 7335]|uniref:RRXRR domain-containing protein n=1 Tax=Synechococcus sp. (strain ATCC 29403 / PCC 7335) TaxID=91464 RepID=UPI00017EB573|nr:RRXRR domain-containing protein [Synechococcus sp. PCC 7335]EDX82558.1 hypothetical protein S7335_1262 [Synechococcus sp. PCC 7335]